LRFVLAVLAALACTQEQALTPSQSAVAAAFESGRQPLVPGARSMTFARMPVVPDHITPLDRKRWWARTGACSAELAITGTVRRRTFLTTPAKKNVWGEYDFEVDQSHRGDNLAVGKVIKLARPGGVVCTERGELVVEDQDYPVLEVGQRYLLFLRSAPGDYYFTSSMDWKITGDKAQLLREDGDVAVSEVFSAAQSAVCEPL